MSSSPDSAALARDLAGLAAERGLVVAVAESLTGGKLASTLASAPNAADWFAGGVVAYSAQSKYSVLNVAPGPVVSETCALDMAAGAARLFDAGLTAAVTGVGGPGRQEGKPPGTVWFAVAGQGPAAAEHVLLSGTPGEIVDRAVEQALRLLLGRARARRD